MAKRLFSYPPTDELEAQCVGKLLDQRGIAYYQTPGSRWGFSNAAIWIKHDEDYPIAKKLFEQHQIEFAGNARKQYQAETGYDPQASFTEKLRFSANHLLKRKLALLIVLLGFSLVVLYFYLFFSLFT